MHAEFALKCDVCNWKVEIQAFKVVFMPFGQ